MERALTVAEELEKTRQPPDYELDLRAARALALHRLGRREEAAAELARLQELAAAESAEPIAVALWREVAAVLAN
jgi:hypothetical protein